jgi:hypothetical protein
MEMHHKFFGQVRVAGIVRLKLPLPVAEAL